MNYIKNIFADEQNQLYVKKQIDEHLRKKFNINIENIPPIDTQIQEYMYIRIIQFINKYQLHCSD